MSSKTNLMRASNQWASRPADERYWNLQHLIDEGFADHKITKTANILPKNLRFLAGDGGELQVVGSEGKHAVMTNWSFGQICNRIGAPSGYLQKLHPELAATNLNYGIKNMMSQSSDPEDKLNLLLRIPQDCGTITIRSFLTTQYSRIWNYELARQLLPATERGWVVPPARPAVDDPRARPATQADILPNQGDFGLSVKVGDMIAPAGVYCGDRDMFIFMVNPNRLIDDGVKGLMRGVFLWNSVRGLLLDAGVVDDVQDAFDVACDGCRACLFIGAVDEAAQLDDAFVGGDRDLGAARGLVGHQGRLHLDGHDGVVQHRAGGGLAVLDHQLVLHRGDAIDALGELHLAVGLCLVVDEAAQKHLALAGLDAGVAALADVVGHQRGLHLRGDDGVIELGAGAHSLVGGRVGPVAARQGQAGECRRDGEPQL